MMYFMDASLTDRYTELLRFDTKRAVTFTTILDSVTEKIKQMRKADLWGTDYALCDTDLKGMKVLLFAKGKENTVLVQTPSGAFVDVTYATEDEVSLLSMGKTGLELPNPSMIESLQKAGMHYRPFAGKVSIEYHRR